MSAWFDRNNLPGFAKWARFQSREEWGHGLRLFDFLHNRGARAELGSLQAAGVDYSSPLKVMESALKREQQTTKLITDLYKVAGDEQDFATQAQLQWFLTEQIEEERTVDLAVEQLRMGKDQAAAVLMLDREMGARGMADKS
jgi:ferritin